MVLNSSQSSPDNKFNLSTFIFYLAVFSIPFDIVFSTSLARMTLTEVLFSIVIGAWFFRIIRTPGRITLAPYFVPLFLFLAACMLSLLAARNSFATARETIQFAWLFGVFYFVAHEIAEEKKILTTWSLLITAACMLSLLGLYQYFYVREPIDFLIAETRLRAHGTYAQPNPFASYLIGTLTLLCGLYLLGGAIPGQPGKHAGLFRIFLNRKIILIGLFIISAGLLATFSRGSWIGLACGMIILFFWLRKKNRWQPLAVMLGVMGIAAILILVDVSRQPALIERGFSNQQRVLLAKTAVSMFLDHPWVGVGFGNFPERLPQYASSELIESLQRDYDPATRTWFTNPNKKPEMELVHNILLQVAAEAGLAGFVAFIGLFLIYYWQALKRLRDSRSEPEYYMRATALASVTAILCAGMFGWPFSHGVQELLIINMGLAVSPQNRIES